jgi:hypothetical protein
MYNYATERPWTFTDSGVLALFKAYKTAVRLIDVAGVANGMKITEECACDTYKMLALLDRLVELGQLREVTGPTIRGQDRIFVLR